MAIEENTSNQPASTTQRSDQENNEDPQKEESAIFSIRNTKFILGAVIFLIIGIIVLMAINVKKPSTITTKEDVLLATVGDQKIYKSEVENLAKEQYVPSAIDNKVLQIFLDLDIERKILDLEAKKLGITVSQEEVNSSIYKKQASGSANKKSLEQFIKYQILKEKIMAKQVKSVEAYVIGFWIPPNTEFNTPEFVTQRADGGKALNEVLGKIENGEEPYAVTVYAYNKYSSLKPILGLNGYNFGNAQDPNLYKKPRVFLLDKEATAKYNDPEFYDLMSEMVTGQVRLYNRANGAGGAVIKVVSKQDSDYKTYDEFFKSKYEQIVKIQNKL